MDLKSNYVVHEFLAKIPSDFYRDSMHETFYLMVVLTDRQKIVPKNNEKIIFILDRMYLSVVGIVIICFYADNRQSYYTEVIFFFFFEDFRNHAFSVTGCTVRKQFFLMF